MEMEVIFNSCCVLRRAKCGRLQTVQGTGQCPAEKPRLARGLTDELIIADYSHCLC